RGGGPRRANRRQDRPANRRGGSRRALAAETGPVKFAVPNGGALLRIRRGMNRRLLQRVAGLAFFALLGGVCSVLSMPRVGLLDFTADDNSSPASQAARNFTAVLQTQLSDAGVDWVEREQLRLAERELHLSDLGLMAGRDAVRRGKWV